MIQNFATEDLKKGIMEEWNIGMMGKKIRTVKPIIPSFHYSSIPMFFRFHHSSSFALRLIFFFVHGGASCTRLKRF
jgi:hypothetical protein